MDLPTHNRLCPGVQVALQGLPLELARMGKGDVYWINATERLDLRALCQKMLVDADVTAFVALIGHYDYSDLLDTAPLKQGPADLRFYQLKKNTQRGLSRLTKDLDRALNPRSRLLIVVLDETTIPSSNSAIARLLKTWKTWLSRNDCTMLLMSHGAAIASRLSGLLPFNNSLAGLAVLETDETSSAYHVYHWRTALGVIGTVRIPLARDKADFHVVEYAPEMNSWSGDQSRFFLDPDALEGTPVFMAADWHVCDGWESLYRQGMLATAATIVFAFCRHFELERLARILHALRQQRGRALKLVVRVMQHPLRYHDKKMLLDCGATMVVPHSTHLAGFLGLLETVQSQTFTRPLVKDVELLIKQRRVLQVSGVMSASEFTALLEQVHEQTELATATGVLVELFPVPGLSVQHALTQSKIRRLGDIACQLEGVVYLFLSGCSPALVDTALGNVFRLPFREIFSKYRLYHSIPDIATKNKALASLAAKHNEPTAKTDTNLLDSAPSALEGGDAFISTAPASTEHLKDPVNEPPRLEPLLLD